jgi:hypothetical protein
VSFGLADDAGNGARIPTLAKIVLDMRRAQHRVGPFRSATDNCNLDLDFLPAERPAVSRRSRAPGIFGVSSPPRGVMEAQSRCQPLPAGSSYPEAEFHRSWPMNNRMRTFAGRARRTSEMSMFFRRPSATIDSDDWLLEATAEALRRPRPVVNCLAEERGRLSRFDRQ